MTFTEKNLRFTFTLSNNATFEGTDSSTLIVTGLRASISAKGSGLPAFPEAEMQIYGLRQDDMNALIALQFGPLSTLTLRRNTVVVEANGGDGWSTIFAGQIITAGPDYTNMPDVALRVQARVLGFESINPATPSSYTGPTDVATIVQSIAARMGYAFENNGVVVQLDSPYLPGTLAEQLRSVVKMAGIDSYVEGNVIAITPKGQPRETPNWVLSPETGLVGYPTLDSRGFIQTIAIFNPAFRFGGRVRIEGSELPRANGDWLIGVLTNKLETLKPDGSWFSELLCYPPGSLPPIS